MKSALASLELFSLTKELSVLKGTKVSQIYELGKNDFLFQMHQTGSGKVFFRLRPPHFLFLLSDKPEMEGNVSGFCSLLRQKLPNMRVLEQKQHGFDRVWVLAFGFDSIEYYLIAEFFSKGNLVLADKDLNILGALIEQSFGIRSTEKGKKYFFPAAPMDPFLVDEKAFNEILDATPKDQIVKCIAMDFSLGGVYAEEICVLANVDKKLPPQQVSAGDRKKLFHEINALESKKSPVIVFKDFQPADFFLFPISSFSSLETKNFETFSEAQSVYCSLFKVNIKVNPRKQKVETMISAQSRQLGVLEQTALDSRQKGEAFYLHYHELKEILDDAQNLLKNGGFKKIEEKLKGNPLVKGFKEKEGIILIEFSTQ